MYILIVLVQLDTVAACLPGKKPKEMTNRTGIFESPGYPSDNPGDEHCSWYIHVEDASEVRIRKRL